MPDTSFAVLDADLRRLFAFWKERKGARLAPSRADMDPLNLRYILGNLLLVDVLRDPLRFRYRLCGTNVVTRAGFDLTGRFVDEHPEPQFREVALERYRLVLEIGGPHHTLRDAALDGRTRRYEVLMLPLASDGTEIDMIMVGMKYFD